MIWEAPAPNLLVDRSKQTLRRDSEHAIVSYAGYSNSENASVLRVMPVIITDTNIFHSPIRS